MRLAFVDESGAPSPAHASAHLVVAALVVASGRSLELHVRRARRALHRRIPTSGELKASDCDPRIIRRMLEAIAEEPCEIYAAVLDKHELVATQAEATYRSTVARVVAPAAERHSRLHVMLDRRYTNLRQQLRLEQSIREAVAHIQNQVIIIEQADSAQEPGLQAVDFVAWALAQQANGAIEWGELLAARIVAFEVISKNKTAALPGGR